MKKLFLLVVLCLTSVAQASHCRGGGGDGPVPMFEPNPFQSTFWTEYKIKGPVKEFIYWEKKEEVVYRNASSEVRRVDLGWNTDSRFFGYPWEIVRTTDPGERFVVTRHETSVVDTASDPISIAQIRTPDPFSDAVFWHGDTLFGLMGTRQRLAFFGYRAGTQDAFSCNVPIHEDGVQLASGAKYPYAYLYRQEENSKGTQLTLYKVRLSTHWMTPSCEVVSRTKFVETLPGRVNGVHVIRGGEAFTIEIENEVRPILYSSREGCVYPGFDGSVPMVLNSGLPFVAGRTAQGKLQLFDLEKETKRQLLTPDEFEDSDPNKLWMTQSGADLLAVIKDGSKGKQKLVRFELR